MPSRSFATWCLASAILDVVLHVEAVGANAAQNAIRLMRRDNARWAQAAPVGQQVLEISQAGTFVAPEDQRLRLDESGEHELVQLSHISPELWKLNGSSPTIYSKLFSNASGPNDSTFTVACAAGWLVVGGGCLARDTEDVITSEKDPDSNGWRCMTGDHAADKTKKVWAICALSCASATSSLCQHSSCGGSQCTIIPHRTCKASVCTSEECCHAAPTCASFTEGCPADMLKLEHQHQCSSAVCTDNDCCTNRPKCTDWTGECSCSSSKAQIPNFEHHTCTGSTCTDEECCEQAPTCSSFQDDTCTGAHHPDVACCSGACSCAVCYA